MSAGKDVINRSRYYTAALIAISPNAQSARAFMTYLASRDGRALFAANGISE